MGMKGESYSRVCLQGSSQSLPGVKGVEDVCITPCQALGGFLTSSVPVNLFIYSATIILHLFIKPVKVSRKIRGGNDKKKYVSTDLVITESPAAN